MSSGSGGQCSPGTRERRSRELTEAWASQADLDLHPVTCVTITCRENMSVHTEQTGCTGPTDPYRR